MNVMHVASWELECQCRLIDPAGPQGALWDATCFPWTACWFPEENQEDMLSHPSLMPSGKGQLSQAQGIFGHFQELPCGDWVAWSWVYLALCLSETIFLKSVIFIMGFHWCITELAGGITSPRLCPWRRLPKRGFNNSDTARKCQGWVKRLSVPDTTQWKQILSLLFTFIEVVHISKPWGGSAEVDWQIPILVTCTWLIPLCLSCPLVASWKPCALASGCMKPGLLHIHL